MTTDGNESKGRRRRTAKPASQLGAKVKLTLRIDLDTAERFKLHALMTRKEQCDLFTDMVKSHCRRFVVHDHGKDAGESADAGAA